MKTQGSILSSFIFSAYLGGNVSSQAMSEGLEVQNPIKPAMISCDEIYGHLNEDECQNAIEKLPNDISSDITYDPPSGRYLYPRFSRTMADPRFKLPLIQGAGECQVQISLAFGSQSNSTLWSIIRRQASLIVQDCVRRRNGIGGSSIAGREGEIRISLIQEPPPPERIPFEVSSGMKRDFFNGRSFMVVVSGRGFEGAHSTACQNTLSLVRYVIYTTGDKLLKPIFCSRACSEWTSPNRSWLHFLLTRKMAEAYTRES